MFGKFLGILAVILLLSGCGGGGGGGGTASLPIPSGVLVSGVAASGAPIQGIVYAKDQTGKTSIPAVINSNGTYTVTVANLTSPYLLTAVGISGGKPVTLHSMADTSDTSNGNVNITPLTEMILALASGVSGDYLESTCFTASGCPPLSASQIFGSLSSAQTTIRNMISPLLTQMGISSAVDLRTTSFSANNTGLDAVLDALSIDIPAMNTTANISLAGIGTVLGSVTLPSTVGNQPSASGGSTSYNTAQVSNLATALQQINTCLGSLQGLYANGIPTKTQVAPYLVQSSSTLLPNGLLNDGNDLTKEEAALTTDVSSGGVASPGMKILGGALADPAIPIYSASFTGNNPNSIWIYLTSGQSTLGLTEMTPTGASTGSCPGGWQIAGDQRYVGVTIQPVISKTIQGSSISYNRLLVLSVDAVSAQAKSVTSANISGPGLPANGVNLAFATGQPQFVISGDSYYSNSSSLKDCADVGGSTTNCFDSNLVSGSIYTTKLYNSSNVLIYTYTDRLDQAPYSKTDMSALAANLFPSITSISPSSSSNISPGTSTSVTANWTLPSYPASTTLYLGITFITSTTPQGAQASLTSSSATAGTVSVTAPSSFISALITLQTRLNGLTVLTNKYF